MHLVTLGSVNNWQIVRTGMCTNSFRTTGFKNWLVSSTTIVDGGSIRHRYESEESLLFFPSQITEKEALLAGNIVFECNRITKNGMA